MSIINIGFDENDYSSSDESSLNDIDGPIIQTVGSIRPGDRYDSNIIIVDCNIYTTILGIVWPRRFNYFWLVKDCCGIVCAVITWLLIIYANYVVMYVVILSTPYIIHGWINGIMFQSCVILACISHLRAMFSDPGAVPRNNATKEKIEEMNFKTDEVIYKCPKCVSIKPHRAHHCSICQRCIRKMDHHCPWVNNCVGEQNQKYFVLFTFYICVSSFHALYLVIFHFIVCSNNNWSDCKGSLSTANSLMLMFLLFEALLFGLFTAIMFGSQLSSVCSDQTGIESLKSRSSKAKQTKRHWISNARQVFGSRSTYHWFSPFHSVQPFFPEDLYSV